MEFFFWAEIHPVSIVLQKARGFNPVADLAPALVMAPALLFQVFSIVKAFRLVIIFNYEFSCYTSYT